MQLPVSQTIVVTGASSGIGREIALQLAGPQRVIWLVGRNQARLDEVAGLVTAKGAVAKVARLDLADLDGAEIFLNGTFPASEQVDTVYLGAAVTQFGEIKDTLPEDWDRIYRTNLLSSIQWTLHFYGHMVERKAGSIVLISSLAGYAGYPTATAYATMKAGLLGLFRSLWHEARSHGVAIHIASPGYVDTPIYKTAVFRKTSYEEIMSQIKSLGFGSLTAENAASRILKSVADGKSEFAFPRYASAMKWISPRLPFLIDMIHSKLIKSFRHES